jgi:uncharacterized protein (DUF2336 family)
LSSADFRHIASGGEPAKAERLFRAAVSAFCSLTRPSRREIVQLEDLALPLFDMVSDEAKRFVAAALSECDHAPKALVRLLCAEAVDIAAPLLVRSNALDDADLVGLALRHGAGHARAIASRPGISAIIIDRLRTGPEADSKDILPMPSQTTPPSPLDQREPDESGLAAEEAREKLRAIMREARSTVRFENRAGKVFDESAGVRHYEKLRSTALTGIPAFFQTALADALDVEFARARSLTETGSYYYLMVALRALGLDETQAFLLTAATFPSHFVHPETIRLFLERYSLLHRDAAIEKVGYWKVDGFSVVPSRLARQRRNDNAKATPAARLKAS